MKEGVPVVVLFGNMNDKFGSDSADSDGFNFVNIDLAFDG
jgi:hypothetical protein